jgi:N-acetyl-gamma-glutamyl-phosphate reductase
MNIKNKKKVFIDGEAGTTGLHISQRLESRKDVELIQLNPCDRKDTMARKKALNDADIAVLCLPDTAAIEAVKLAEGSETVIIDASSAHRVAPGWTYGFTEYKPEHRKDIKKSKRITNPGCYAIGAISLLYPLIREKIIPSDYPLSIHAISGYSGGGKSLIADFESIPNEAGKNGFSYALDLNHKHLPEIQHLAGTSHYPVFSPSVGPYMQGMLVNIPLNLRSLSHACSASGLIDLYRQHYANEYFIPIADLGEIQSLQRLDPQTLNGTNKLKIYVLHDKKNEQVMLVAQLDNLGKGASGQVVQTINLLLDVDEKKTLT